MVQHIYLLLLHTTAIPLRRFKDVCGNFFLTRPYDCWNSQVYGIFEYTYYIVSPVVGTGYIYVISVFLRNEML